MSNVLDFPGRSSRCPCCGRETARPQTLGMTMEMKRLRDFIKDYSAENGYPPSFDEMKCALGLGSKSGVHRLVLALEERGHIVRLQNRARAIEVLS